MNLDLRFLPGGPEPSRPAKSARERKALLICPYERPAVSFLAEPGPLVCAPILGQGLLEYWLAHLASLGVGQVRILTVDRPEAVSAQVAGGERWGLRVEVIPELCELAPAEARAKYRCATDAAWLPRLNDAVLVDHLPDLPQFPLFNSCAGWFAALQAWMPRATTPGRLGPQQVRAGVWIGRHARVSRTATLHPPCWVGEAAYVGPAAVIGPGAILEDWAFVEAGSRISYSAVGPETWVGKLTNLEHSLAWGHTLIDWRDGSRLEVLDDCLLSPLAAGPGEAPGRTRPASREALMA